MGFFFENSINIHAFFKNLLDFLGTPYIQSISRWEFKSLEIVSKHSEFCPLSLSISKFSTMRVADVWLFSSVSFHESCCSLSRQTTSIKKRFLRVKTQKMNIFEHVKNTLFDNFVWLVNIIISVNWLPNKTNTIRKTTIHSLHYIMTDSYCWTATLYQWRSYCSSKKIHSLFFINRNYYRPKSVFSLWAIQMRFK